MAAMQQTALRQFEGRKKRKLFFSFFLSWGSSLKTKKKTRSAKNAKKSFLNSNVYERDIPVYGHDRRLPGSKFNAKYNGRLMEARYGKETKKNYAHEGDLNLDLKIYNQAQKVSQLIMGILTS